MTNKPLTTNPRNLKRANRVRIVLMYYKHQVLKESGPVEFADLVDLLADMRHYADWKNECYGDADKTAHMHYLAELAGDE